MFELLVAIIIGFTGFLFGITEQADTFQRRCEAKYADMPHNKVTDHCKTLLKFEKDAKQ
jgi:hypothetical protein